MTSGTSGIVGSHELANRKFKGLAPLEAKIECVVQLILIEFSKCPPSYNVRLATRPGTEP